MNKKAKRFTSVLLTVLMALSMFMTSFATPANGFENMAELSGAEAVSEVVAAEAAEEQAEQAAAPAEEIAEVQEEELLGAGATYLAFTSDVHNQSGDKSVTRFSSWLNTVSDSKIGADFDRVGITGDLGPASGSSNDFWSNAKKVFNTIVESDDVTGDGDDASKYFVVPGNHEYSPGNFSQNLNDTTKKYSVAGTNVEDEDGYILYSLGAVAGQEDLSGSVSGLRTFLNSKKNYSGPIFILSHYPMHSYNGMGMGWGQGGTSGSESTGIHDGNPAKGSSEIIKLLNDYCSTNKKNNLFFIFGHNHSSSKDHYDRIYTGNMYASGDDKASLSQEILFTYCAAGCMSDTEYGSSGNVKGKGLVAKIYSGKVTLQYYDKNGSALKSATEIDLSKAPEAGSGSGSDTGSTDSSGNAVFEQVDKFEIGGSYLIVNEDSGSAKALANNSTSSSSNGFATEQVTISNGKITVANNSKAIWEAVSTGTGTGLIGLKNGNNVLKVDASSTSSPYIKTGDTSYNAGGFGYTNNNHVSYPYGQNPQDYYIGSDSSKGFKASNTESNLGKVYIFKKTGSGSDTPVVDPSVPSTTTVDITPSTDNPSKTANIKVGESVTVKLTNGSNNSAYDFEITSSNDGVARPSTGSINVGTQATKEFTITGASAGTATIKITNNNGTGSGSSWGGSWGGSWGSSWGGGSTSYERVATITVNVTGSGSDTPVVDPTDPSTTDITVAPTTEKPSYSAQIKAGETIDVNIYYESQNTSDNSWTFTLTSGNTSVAKVEGSASVTLSNKQTGPVKVKGVSEGTVKLTIQNDNTQYPEYTRYAYVNLSVTSAGTDVPEETTEVAVPSAKQNLVYNGSEQTGVEEGIGYTLTGNKGTNAGSYTAKATLKTNYVWADKTTAPKEISWSIEKATYDMSGVEFKSDTFPYDGKEHSIFVEGELPKGVEVTYQGNGQKELGTYPVQATFTVDDTNYNPIDPKTKTAYLTITVNEIDVPVAIENLTYTGKMLTGVAEGIGYTLSNHKAIDAGMYTATATLDENYMWKGGSTADKLIYWSIEQASYDMSGVKFEGETFPYDGMPKSIYISGQLPAGVSVAYLGNNQYAEGTHNVVAKFSGDTKNYKAIYEKTATITIVPNKVTVPSAKTNLVYSGREQTGVPEGAGYTLTGHKETNAGSYTAKAALKHGFTWADGSKGDQYIGWSIDKATYDMSGVKFLDAEFEYDGKEKSIEISGVLPAGVTVSYSGNKRTVEGSNLATAKFTVDTKNYNAIANMYATITIKKTSGSGTTGGGSTGGGSTGGGSTGGGSTGGGSTGGGSTGGGSGAGGASGGPTSAKGATATYSGNWYTDAAGIWRIKNNAGQVVANAWLCDDVVAANGQNVWYLLNADGSMIINGLVQDNTGNFFSIETSHNGYYGMLRYQDGYYDCNGTQVYLQFSRAHDGTFGAVINPEGIAALQAIYGVTRFGVDNSNCVYTAKF